MGNKHSHKSQSNIDSSNRIRHTTKQPITFQSSFELTPFAKLPTLEDIKNAQGLSNCLINEQRFTCNKGEQALKRITELNDKDNIGLLILKFEDGIYKGTGYLIDADFETCTGVILTCAHNFVKIALIDENMHIETC